MHVYFGLLSCCNCDNMRMKGRREEDGGMRGVCMSWRDERSAYVMEGREECVCHGGTRGVCMSWRDERSVYVMEG